MDSCHYLLEKLRRFAQTLPVQATHHVCISVKAYLKRFAGFSTTFNKKALFPQDVVVD